jgi:hypothetical protein
MQFEMMKHDQELLHIEWETPGQRISARLLEGTCSFFRTEKRARPLAFMNSGGIIRRKFFMQCLIIII